MKHVVYVMLIFSFLSVGTVALDDVFAKSLSTTKSPYSTKTHFQRITRKPQKPSCRPFNPFCVPCRVSVSLARTSLDHIVFIHNGIESVCSNVLGRHKVCDVMVDITKFYLDHTPTERICKRFFMCGNKGLWDWWLDSDHQYNLSANNFRILQILSTPSNQSSSENFIRIRKNIVSYLQSGPDFALSDFPENIDYQIADFVISILKVAEILDKEKRLLTNDSIN